MRGVSLNRRRESLSRCATMPPRHDGSGTPMRAAVHAQLRSGFDPGPARGTAFVAGPWLALEHARRGCDVEMTFGARQSSGAGVPRNFRRVGCSFAVRTIGPGAWQVSVLVTMQVAGLHACSLNSPARALARASRARSEEHTSELQSLAYLVC